MQSPIPPQIQLDDNFSTQICMDFWHEVMGQIIAPQMRKKSQGTSGSAYK